MSADRRHNVLCDTCGCRLSVIAEAPSEPGGVHRSIARSLLLVLARAFRWTVNATTGEATCPRCAARAEAAADRPLHVEPAEAPP